MPEAYAPQTIEVAPADIAAPPLPSDGGAQEAAQVDAQQPEAVEPDKAAKPEVKAKDRSISDIVKDAVAKSAAETKAKEDAKAGAEPDAEQEAEKAAKDPAEKKAERQRGEGGKFAPKAAAEGEANAEPPVQQKATAYKDAPARFDDGAKKDWESVPESVRGAIHRTHRELEQGIQRYKQTSERYDTTFKRFDELARSHNVDAGQALERYVQLDQTLRRDLVTGLGEIVAAQGLKRPDGQPVTLRDVAAHILGQKPDQVASRQDATIHGLRSEIQQLKQQLGGVQTHFQQQQRQQMEGKAAEEWSRFASENPGAQEMEAEIAEILKSFPPNANMGWSEILAAAFAIAKQRNPNAAHTRATAQAQNLTPAPRAPKPEGQKSIPSGSPSDAATRPAKKQPAPSIKDAVSRAMRDAAFR